MKFARKMVPINPQIAYIMAKSRKYAVSLSDANTIIRRIILVDIKFMPSSLFQTDDPAIILTIYAHKHAINTI